jgi:hypothetical protein
MIKKKPLPKKVYFVDRYPGEGEARRYYGPGRMRRFYMIWQHVVLFVNSHPTSKFKIYEADVEWTEVSVDERRE